MPPAWSPRPRRSEHGCDQVVFLDAAEQRWVEELGGMNMFFVIDDGSIVTPPLGGTILPGITRDSMHHARARHGHRRSRGAAMRSTSGSADAASGRLTRSLRLRHGGGGHADRHGREQDGEFTIGSGGPGTRTEELKAALVGIQRGRRGRPAWLDPQGLLAVC